MEKTALVTGGSIGIGSGIVRALAAQGYQIGINYRTHGQAADDLAKEIREKYGVKVITCQADVACSKQVEAMVAEVTEQLGQITLLVNNAGIAQQKLFTEITEAEWDRLFDVNVKGMFLCSKAVLPNMIHNHSGNIINISSIWGMVGASCEVHYSAAKAAIIGFTKALAKEVGPSLIRVNCVAPGVIDTEMNANLSEATLAQLKEETPLCKIGTIEDIANAVIFLAGEQSSFITGQVISPNGGMV